MSGLVKAWRRRVLGQRSHAINTFRGLFERFRELLDYNNRVLELIADMGEKLSGDYVFDTHYLESLLTELDDLVYKIIYNLNFITDNRYLALYESFEKARKSIHSEITTRWLPARRDLVAPLSETNLDMIDLTGAKMASLGEVGSRLKQPTPRGFVITTNSYLRFMDQPEIQRVVKETQGALVSGDDPAELSARISEVIVRSRLPLEVERALRREVKSLEDAGHHHFAVRSSELGEDTELTYAGQYRSFLQVPPSQVETRYKEVVASLFSPEAMVYRSEHGITPEQCAMAVGVLAMVEPVSSGVMYTRDPQAADQDVIIVSAAWGLARTVVEGSAETDFYRVHRTEPFEVEEHKVAVKVQRLVADEAKGEREEEVPPEEQNAPCLQDKDLRALAELANRLESYFKKPQDVEWSIDREGALVILQSRPLQLENTGWVRPEEIALATRSRKRLMDQVGMVACRGIGAGRVVQVLHDEDFERFTQGSVLVARTTSPKLSRLMPLASAVVTDIGAPTGHMSTIAREYRIPTLVDTHVATQVLTEGMEVTVDAEERVIYEGVVRELLRFQVLMDQPFAEAREFRVLRRLLKKISPLNLTDPQSNEFTAENCRTYHDITRFAHEMSVKEFIELHLRGRRWKRVPTFRLELPVPLGLVIINIGEAVNDEDTYGQVLRPEQITSSPMKALLDGLCQKGVWRTDPVDLDFRSFMTSFTRTFDSTSLDPANAQNLAVISRDYLNLNLRLGYHFNMVDAIMTENRNDNYIYFRFLGGVTDSTRRARRVQFLAQVLDHYDFVTEAKGDLVVARIKKISKVMMEDRLAMLGRLIGYSRQLDVLMRSEEAVERFTREFIALGAWAGEENPERGD